MIGIISGSGFYDLTVDQRQEKTITTPYGEVMVTQGKINETDVTFISRHGSNHRNLPNMINHRANIKALEMVGVKAIIGTTVCGLLNDSVDLATLLVFSDLFFPDNRLPNGEICSFFTQPGEPGRGHLIFDSPFNREISHQIAKELNAPELTYGHANGPRFNSKPEISFFKTYADAVSQTCGPEVILAGELEIPYILLGVGVDFANGIKETPTPIEILNKNLELSQSMFTRAIESILRMSGKIAFEGFVYRFE